MKEVRERLAEICGRSAVKWEEPMKNHTSFRTGGNAEVFSIPKNESEIKAILNLCNKPPTNKDIINAIGYACNEDITTIFIP